MPPRLPALLLAALLGLLAARPARAQQTAAFDAGLEAAAKSAPKAACALGAGLPADFKAALAGAGLKVQGQAVLGKDGKTPLTNERVAALYFAFKNARLQAKLGTAAPAPLGLPADAGTLPSLSAAGAAAAAPGKAFDGSGKPGDPQGPEAPPDIPPGGRPAGKPEEKPANKARHGLRLLGIELGSNSRPADRDEPFERKGVRDPLDWDIRALAPLQGLGVRAYYRHPLPWRSLSASFLKYWDWPGAVGLDGAREGLYGAFGATPEKPKGGFELTLGSQIDAHWGVFGRYDAKESLSGEREKDSKQAQFSFGFSPLGDNPGKSWNYTLIGALNYQNLERRYPDLAYHDKRDGFGYSAGVAFQKALDRLPWKWLGPSPDGNGWLWLDRAKLTTYAAQSEISSLSFTTALELSVFVSKHVLLTPGVSATWRPEPEAGDPDEKTFSWGPTFGLDLKDLL